VLQQLGKSTLLDRKCYNVEEPTSILRMNEVFKHNLQKLLKLIPHSHGILLLTETNINEIM